MIKKLIIKNFQSHKESIFDFSKGFNVIIGTGDSGKTSSLRALNWVRSNRPLGEGFIRTGTEEASVKLELSDEVNSWITRTRGKTNSYTIHTDSNSEDMVLTAFGNNVPEEVSSLINMDEINIQWQTNPYYLVYESAGQIALIIRETYGLDQIDKVISNIGSKIRVNNGKLENVELELNDINTEIKELENIDLIKLKNLIEEAEIKINNKLNKELLVKNLSKLINDIKNVNNRISSIPENLDDIIKQSEKELEKYEFVLSSVNSIKLTIKQIKTISIPCIKADEIDEVIRKTDILNKYTKINSKLTNLESLISKIKFNDSRIEEFEQLVKAQKELINTSMEELTECPYCGEDLNETSKEKLLNNE